METMEGELTVIQLKNVKNFCSVIITSDAVVWPVKMVGTGIACFTLIFVAPIPML